VSTLRIQHESREPVPGAPTDPVSSWLDVLEKLLDLPVDESRSIREELASHLRERVRDLTLTGMNEGEAVRAAISELGDAAELARRFHRARSPSRRRHVMNIILAATASAALVGGGVAVRSAGQSAEKERARLTQENDALKQLTGAVLAQDDAAANQALLKDLAPRAVESAKGKNEITRGAILSALAGALAAPQPEFVVNCEQTDTWQQLFDSIAKGAGKGSFTNFNSLDPLGIVSTQQVGLKVGGMKLEDAIRFLNENFPDIPGNGRIDYRVTDSMIEFASEEYFDRRERTTRTYSIDPLVRSLLDKEAAPPQTLEGVRHSHVSAEKAVGEDISQLIMEMVETNMWMANGGTLASIRRFGGKLFITAPLRHFERIEWVLREAGAMEPVATADGAPRNVVIAVDPETNGLVVVRPNGDTLRCSTIELPDSNSTSATLDSAVWRRGVPVLSSVPTISRFFTDKAGMESRSHLPEPSIPSDGLVR
jgi:hypothetical protein